MIRSFWPRKRGDKACPKCESELFIVEEFDDNTGDPFMYRVKCFECGEQYFITTSIAHTMMLNLREIPRAKFEQ